MAQDRKSQSGNKAQSRETTVNAEEVRTAEAAKTLRLRALRLAKEAAERAVRPRKPRRLGLGSSRARAFVPRPDRPHETTCDHAASRRRAVPLSCRSIGHSDCRVSNLQADRATPQPRLCR